MPDTAECFLREMVELRQARGNAQASVAGRAGGGLNTFFSASGRR